VVKKVIYLEADASYYTTLDYLSVKRESPREHSEPHCIADNVVSKF